MQFYTISQYFFRLYNAILVLMIVPILTFGGIYWYMTMQLQGSREQDGWLILSGSMLLLDWMIVAAIFAKRIKSIGNLQGLRLKLEKYFTLTIVRYSLLSSASLMLGCIFLISNDDRVTALFVANLIFAALYWPLPRVVCRQLKLKGDEREMVYFKKDELS